MLNIVHISDLHFCEDILRSRLQSLHQAVLKSLNFELGIEAADRPILNALARSIQGLDPDVIVISGDITTFGDKKSFEEAAQWLQPLLTRSGGQQRRCVVVPGNHDIMAHQLMTLKSRLKSSNLLLRAGVKLKYNAVLAQLDRCLEHAAIKGPEPLANFVEFASRSQVHGIGPCELSIDSHSRLVIHPFRSVSADPLWMNLGETRQLEWERFTSELAQAPKTGGGILRMVVLHHNPVSSPDITEKPIVNAYNSMPGGTDFLKTVQRHGVDLVLHGHQHQSVLFKYDFALDEIGHAYCVGSASSSVAGIAGFNFIRVNDINHASVESFKFNGKSEFLGGDVTNLMLERNRPNDPQTGAARYEIKRYLYGTDDSQEGPLWDEMLAANAGVVYISGRHLREVRERRLDEIEGLLANKNTRIRFLLTDPDLVESVAKRVVDTPGRDLWGPAESMLELADKARKTLVALQAFMKKIGADERSRVDLRLAHTILPFACTVRHVGEPWAKMVVRLLPIGAVGQLTMPVFKLNRRDDQALFQYYFNHLRYLIQKGKTVAGSWSFGEADLKIAGMESANPFS